MKVTKRKGYLRSIKGCCWFLESPFFLHVLKEFASSHVLNNEINSEASLEHKLHADQERMIYLEHDHTLQIYVS